MATQLTFRSDLLASPEEAWRWATSLSGISAELRPIMRMTAPKDIQRITDLQIELGKPMFTSWVFLFGFIPIDRVQLTLVELDEGRGFVEQSPMRSMKLWRHERRIEPTSSGCVLTDALTFESRFGDGLARWFFRKVFEHRHRVLRRELGSPA